MRRVRMMLSAVVLLGLPYVASAQFDSGSDDSDLALDLTGMSGTIDFLPSTYDPPLDADGDGIFNFTTITIPNGVTLRLSGTTFPSPVYFLASGAVTISGIISLDGEAGHTGSSLDFPAIPGAGGFHGGVGEGSTTAGSGGAGPGGGAFDPAGDGGGAGHATEGESNTAGFGETYGNKFLIPMIGGSGGAGGAIGTGVRGSGGGAGGGALLIASSESIAFGGGSSGITARGGTGGSPSSGSFRGGGGSGGAVRLIAPVISGFGPINVDRGFSSTSDGGVGRIRFDTNVYNYGGVLTGTVELARLTPDVVFLPTDVVPAVQVISIDGMAVPPAPTGSFVMPDVTINNGGAVTIALEASGVPIGTVVRLNIYNDIDGNMTVDSTPLAGATIDSTTATASATFSSGVSQILVRATWTP